MSFRRRTYPEIMENVLTGLTGGISAENHAYPPNNAGKNTIEHALEHPPVAAIISVYGVRNNQTFQFVKASDYQLKNDKLIWLEKGNRPDLGSNFLVNYLSKDASSPVNDLHVGSVLRTLAESFSLELAGLYAQAEAVYQSGFIDTANNRSLENVVALLGINRIRAGRNSTKVKFTRSQSSVGDIHIPAGTRISTVDAGIQFETIESVTLLSGQNSVQVDARDIADNLEGLSADSLVILTKPLAGVDSVTNPKSSWILERDESDNELRTRAKNFLHGSERATLSAIRQAIAVQNLHAEVTENDPDPGFISISVHTDNLTPEAEARLLAAIDDVRPAGIKIKKPIKAIAPIAVDMIIRITTADDLLEADLRAIQEQAVEKITTYVNGVTADVDISINRIIGLVLSDNRVTDARILSAMVSTDNVLNRDKGSIDTTGITGIPSGSKISMTTGIINIIDPALATLLSVNILFPSGTTAPSETAIKTALENTVSAINELNDAELPNAPTAEMIRERQINYGKLLAAIPLPGKPAVENYRSIAIMVDGDLPTSAAAGDYLVRFLITSESGVSFILESETSPTISLTPFERLSLSNIELKATAGVPS